jgi:hypothetical protein
MFFIQFNGILISLIFEGIDREIHEFEKSVNLKEQLIIK